MYYFFTFDLNCFVAGRERQFKLKVVENVDDNDEAIDCDSSFP